MQKLGNINMSNHPHLTPKNDNAVIRIFPTAEQAKRALRKEIESKWGKFSEEELTSLSDNSELVSQLAEKYGIEKEKAQADVDAMMNGRHL